MPDAGQVDQTHGLNVVVQYELLQVGDVRLERLHRPPPCRRAALVSAGVRRRNGVKE